MTTRRFLLALFLSIIATFVITTIYALWPLISLLLKQFGSGPETAGVAAVAGGVQVKAFLIMEPIVLLIFLALLYRKQIAQ